MLFVATKKMMLVRRQDKLGSSLRSIFFVDRPPADIPRTWAASGSPGAWICCANICFAENSKQIKLRAQLSRRLILSSGLNLWSHTNKLPTN